MKGNTKKLVILMIVAAMAMFMVVAVASAAPSFPQAIRGEYAAESAASCLLAPFGFNPDGTPVNGIGIIYMQYRQGTFTFEKDGTGSATLNASVVGLSYIGPNGPVPPATYTQAIEFDFTYHVGNDGVITVTQKPMTYFVTNTSGPSKNNVTRVEGAVFRATIAPDGKNMNTYTAATDLVTLIQSSLPPISPNQSCGGAGVLIWQHN